MRTGNFLRNWNAYSRLRLALNDRQRRLYHMLCAFVRHVLCIYTPKYCASRSWVPEQELLSLYKDLQFLSAPSTHLLMAPQTRPVASGHRRSSVLSNPYNGTEVDRSEVPTGTTTRMSTLTINQTVFVRVQTDVWVTGAVVAVYRNRNQDTGVGYEVAYSINSQMHRAQFSRENIRPAN